MATGPARGTTQNDAELPAVGVCTSSPGRAVFIEDGNTDGWIASDLTLDVRR